jgi:hypothetical protein
MSSRKRKFFIIVGALVVIDAATGGALYYAYPVQMSTIGGLTRNYVLSLGAPAGTTTTETNPDYKGAGGAGVPPAATTSTSAAAGDWPSYNRTVNSDRFSPLGEITTANVGKLKVLCTYDVRGYEAFESGLIIWATTIAEVKLGESVPAAPIAHNGVVYNWQRGWRLQGRQGKDVRARRQDRRDPLAVLHGAQGRRRRGSRTPGQVAARWVDVEKRPGHSQTRNP